MRDRVAIGVFAFAADLVVSVAAVAAGLGLSRRPYFDRLLESGLAGLDWSVLIIPVVVVGIFWAYGLHKWEAFVSLWIHLWLIVRSLLAAGVLVVAVLWATHASLSSAVYSSRLVTGYTLVSLAAFVVVIRLFVVGGIAKRIVGRNHRTILVGDGPTVEPLRRRLEVLWGFDDLLRITPNGRGSSDLTERMMREIREAPADEPPVRNVFIDATALPPHTVIELSEAAKEQGCEVYVASSLMRALATRRLLPELFQYPVVRVQRALQSQMSNAAKRAFDVVAAAILSVLLSPVLFAIALAVKLTSPGPVLHAQERVGESGRPFRFYKFRSMAVDCETESHRDYARRFIEGSVESADRRPAAVAYKIVDDPRVTPVGAFLRRYSLDELPQLWNVLKGDMSLVGPRPPLPYEVEVYEDWHSLRLVARPGVCGLWQVDGRSRVTFDEMVLQDVMYACDRSMLTDWNLCVRTIPAALRGHGGA